MIAQLRPEQAYLTHMSARAGLRGDQPRRCRRTSSWPTTALRVRRFDDPWTLAGVSHAHRPRRPAAAPPAARPGTRPAAGGTDSPTTTGADCSTSCAALDLDQLRPLYASATTPSRCRRRSASSRCRSSPSDAGRSPRRRQRGEEALRRRRGGGAGRGRRPGEPARLRPAQGDVPRRPGVEQDAVPDPRREGAGPAPPLRQAAAVPGDDQPRHRRRDAGVLRANTAISACRRTR